MNREIFFKALTTNRKRWIQGNYMQEVNNNHSSGNKNEIIHKIYPRLVDSPPFEIIPETLCQFVGKRDKNGISIMENDLVEFREAGERCICQILFIDGRWTAGRNIDGEDMVLLNGFDCLEDGRVIGNLYD